MLRISGSFHKDTEKPTITPMGAILSQGKDKTYTQITINQSIILHLTKQASSLIPHRTLGGQSKSGMVPLLAVTNKHLSALGGLKIGSPPNSGKTFGRQFFNFMVVFSPCGELNPNCPC